MENYNRVIYFNINYSCNSHCLFCISPSTEQYPNQKLIPCKDILEILARMSPDRKDLIVINGGEPTIHPEFYTIISSIAILFNTNVRIYTNAIALKVPKLNFNARVSFVIPIHGTADIHDYITGTPSSFVNTISNIRNLQQYHFRYTLKFIITTQMIQQAFDVTRFLPDYGLRPNEIMLARMNTTKISRRNQFPPPKFLDLKNYVDRQTHYLLDTIPIKFLDIPPCFFEQEKKKIQSTAKIFRKIPKFYFSDYNHRSTQHMYHKKVKIGDHCDTCCFETLCTIMSQSYLTLSYNKEWEIVAE